MKSNPQEYSLKPITNLFEAFKVRSIRNECSPYMTNDSSQIGIFRQFIWYFKTYNNDNKKGNFYCYLFNNRDMDPLGYATIIKRGGRFWITGGLKQNQRGKGLGKLLFKNLISTTPTKEVWLEVLQNNKAALNLYRNLGFIEKGKIKRKSKNILIMSIRK